MHSGWCIADTFLESRLGTQTYQKVEEARFCSLELALPCGSSSLEPLLKLWEAWGQVECLDTLFIYSSPNNKTWPEMALPRPIHGPRNISFRPWLWSHF